MMRAPRTLAAPVTAPLVSVVPCSAPNPRAALMIGAAVVLNPSAKAPLFVEAS
jgi:hypothetical protein